MHTEYHKWFSPNLGHDMELKVYGHYGKPMLVFPCAGGTFHEFEDFGMVDAIKSFIEAGRVKVFTVASIDNQTWLNQNGHMGDNAWRHEFYDRYITKEVVPFIHSNLQTSWMITLGGNSMGAYHSVNFCLRHPDIFDSTIAMSGIYRLSHLLGSYMDDNVYFNSPLDYLPGLNDPWYLDNLRKSKIIICTGQGAWEYVDDAREIQTQLHGKGIPAWVDFWGHDVNHDWPWWRIQMPYFLQHLV